MPKKMNSLEELLHHMIQDMYSAETQLIEALPKMEEKASNKELKKAIRTHLTQTKKQQQRIEKACKLLGIETEGETCKAMAGLIKESESFMKHNADPDVMDAGIIADAQKVEHYEIASYGTICQYASNLGLEEVKTLMGETLEEEKETDELLNTLAMNINEKAEK
ncbi:MAG: ferritin-like domain-containing protein [Chitinophagales bacterium]|nr:ferritin-like domain-containing protein [Chitinophagales bacterium]